ncbi:MAG: redox-regulated ATPase YchF [Anaerolineaceae bacterium]|jgi:hypothetical protein|nr:MAG: redox-regulated ATPase YchF [Anaerolineaceae bacterium]
MKLGIIGLPQSGKTTIFNALTRASQPTDMSSGKMEIHTGVVDVPDNRVDRLVEFFAARKTVRAKVTYVDIAGLGSGNKGELSGSLLNQLSQMDGLIHVVRCFEDENVLHVLSSINPSRDIANMDAELLLNDQIKIEAKLLRLHEDGHKGGRDKGEIERETKLFEKLNETLQQEKPLRILTLDEEEERLIQGYGFLTRKPMLIILNLSEGQTVPTVDSATSNYKMIPLQGKIEMEIAQLPAEEAQLFLQEYGIEEPGLNRMIRESYELLGLLSFFTAGEKEVHAWTVHKGATAPEAAGTIHSDMQQGFIRAEIMAYSDLMDAGSIAELRNRGKLRVEGKNYIIQDGDIIEIRFNI